MTPAAMRYRHAGLNLRIARARLLLDLVDKVDDAELADLLTFAGQLGDYTAADNLAAFRAAQADLLQAAEAELRRPPGTDGVTPC